MIKKMCLAQSSRRRQCKNVGKYDGYCHIHKGNKQYKRFRPKCLKCDKRPSFNFKGEKELYCKKHADPDMINVVSACCLYETCDTCPTYNFPGEKKTLYCVKHALDGMIDIVNDKCLYDGCVTYPSFNFRGEKKPIFCKKHAVNLMINVDNKTCLCNDCDIHPSFNFKGERPLFCKKHAESLMVDVVNRTCLDCNLRPSFNFYGETCGIFCKKHSKDDMIDVENLRCLKCDTRPSFNFKGERPLFCKNHAESFMVNVVSKTCLECDKIPNFNYDGGLQALFCSDHKQPGMVDVYHKQCIDCGNVRANPKYRDHCLRCFINKFPDETITRYFKIKEQAMINFIKETFPDEVMVFDKRTGGCSGRRPDVFIDKFTYVLIIECDENQHQSKEYTSCDSRRNMELFQDFGNRPLVFIRFNPDKYINYDGKRVESSFKTHKSLDVPIIRDQKEWNSRLVALREKMDYWLTNEPEKEITTEYLFYDP